MRENNDLKMSLDEIRNRIDILKWDWDNLYTTNCYAYALGLDIPENDICKYAYDPGTISKSCPLYIPYSYNQLINNVLADLEILNIEHRFIHPSDSILPDEWKIAIFIPKIYSLYQLEDYHFIRQRNDGLWYYKNGITGPISNLDTYDQFITDPTTCFFKEYMYTDSLCLKLKKPGN